MTLEDRLNSIEDAIRAGALSVSQAATVFADAYRHEVYCETDGDGHWWLVTRGGPVPLPLQEKERSA